MSEAKSERQRTIEFLMGWMMEFGAEPVKLEGFFDNPWWKRAVAELHRPAHNKEVNLYFTNDCARDRYGLNERALELLKGENPTTIPDEPKETT